MPKSEKSGEEIAVDLLGQLSVKYGDAEYMLRPSRQAISNIERGLGKSLTQLTVQSGSLVLTVDEMGYCVAELMKAYGAFNPDAGADYRAPKPERIADLIYEDGPAETAARLAVIFTGAMAGGYTASGEVKAAGKMKTTEPTPTAA